MICSDLTNAASARSRHEHSSMKAIQRRIIATPWASYAQPEWNGPNTMVEALLTVCDATNPGTRKTAYDKLLYAVGNNHAGTYYPVLLPAMPFLGELIESEDTGPAATALCILDDLFASFHPEPGHEEFTDPAGQRVALEKTFRATVVNLRPILELIASKGDANSKLAEGLIDLIMDEPS